MKNIPNFDPTKLPYWDIYTREKKTDIIVGGTIAGQFMAGLSGGQRKLLLFELIFQRTSSQDNLLIALDEPFAGVTDDFVPFIVQRLNEMRKKHNILLVTNDHVNTLKMMADNTVTVSAIDRTTIRINKRDGISRDMGLLAMSIGDEYQYTMSDDDLKFFFDVEFSRNGGMVDVILFTIVAFLLFLLTFWDSKVGNEALVMVAGGIISYFSINPYLLQLVDWRVFMIEEAEALVHSSKTMNKILKSSLVAIFIIAISSIQFGIIQIVYSGNALGGVDIFFGVLFDNVSIMITFALLGLFTNLNFQAIQILAAFPFLLMIFFSTTFSPGSGLKGLNNLRYLFSRFYLWCLIPGLNDQMEGCPDDYGILYLILSSLICLFIFLVCITVQKFRKQSNSKKEAETRRKSMVTTEFAELQVELFGLKALNRLQKLESNADLKSLEIHSKATFEELDDSKSLCNSEGRENEETMRV